MKYIGEKLKPIINHFVIYISTQSEQKEVVFIYSL